jgi:hypothetical protein
MDAIHIAGAFHNKIIEKTIAHFMAIGFRCNPCGLSLSFHFASNSKGILLPPRVGALFVPLNTKKGYG